MKSICAILINYNDSSSLDKAIFSLQPLATQINCLIILHTKNISYSTVNHLIPTPNIHFHPIHEQDVGQTLNNVISNVKSDYVLFLNFPEYLSSSFNPHSIEFSEHTLILSHKHRIKNININMPFLIQTDLLKHQPFLLNHQLPFPEALFPAWLFSINQKIVKEEDYRVKRLRENRSRDLIEKLTFIEKYQEKKIEPRTPTLSVLLPSYNMEKYIETAVISSFLQTELPDQIYVMDDGSSDNTYKKVKAWEQHASIHLFTKQNEGKARAMNDLLEKVNTDFILELDADDWLDPNAIYTIKNYLAQLPKGVTLLYGNFRTWKQEKDTIHFKSIKTGREVSGRKDLLSYRFPLGPRIYRTSALKTIGGFPVIPFKDGRLYEDVSVLLRLIEYGRFQYENFTVYNVREHPKSITRTHIKYWKEFIKRLK